MVSGTFVKREIIENIKSECTSDYDPKNKRGMPLKVCCLCVNANIRVSYHLRQFCRAFYSLLVDIKH